MKVVDLNNDYSFSRVPEFSTTTRFRK